MGVIGGSRVWIIIGAGVCGWALQAGCNGRQGDVLSTKFKDCGQDLAADGAVMDHAYSFDLNVDDTNA